MQKRFTLHFNGAPHTLKFITSLMLQNIFNKRAPLFTFYSLNKIMVSTKILSGTDFFNIDNNDKWSSKSAYLNDF